MQIKARNGRVVFEYEGADREGVERAYRSGIPLSHCDLSGLVLHSIDLKRTDLSHSNLTGVGLSRSILTGCSFFRASLRGANLRESFFTSASLYGADLRGADLRGVHLQGADLREADLREADLSRVDLSGALLIGANLDGANFDGSCITPHSTSVEIKIALPDLIQIGEEQHTIEEWDRGLPDLSPIDLAFYHSCKTFLLMSKEPTPVERISRFERLDLDK